MKNLLIVSLLLLPSLGFCSDSQAHQLNATFHGVKAEGGGTTPVSSSVSLRPEAMVADLSVTALNSASPIPAKLAPLPRVDDEILGSSIGIALGVGLIVLGAVFGGWWVAAIFVGALMAAVSAWLLAKSL